MAFSPSDPYSSQSSNEPGNETVQAQPANSVYPPTPGYPAQAAPNNSVYPPTPQGQVPYPPYGAPQGQAPYPPYGAPQGQAPYPPYGAPQGQVPYPPYGAPQAQGGYPPYGANPYAQVKNARADRALVWGIISLVLSIISLLNPYFVVGIVTGAFAIIYGIQGLSVVRRYPGISGQGKSIAAIIMGAIALLFTLLAFVI